MADAKTIFALSSGALPAGIAVVRISGPAAGPALRTLAGPLPLPRRASYRRLCDPSGAVLDHALVLWFPGPQSATGEDVAELHIHGGRAVAAAVLSVLAGLPGCHPAEAGAFTRRAFENGRIDLSAAEGLADLLAAETELQRQSALTLAEGALGRRVAVWTADILAESARIEALLDFADEGDVAPEPPATAGLAAVADDMAALAASPPAERLRDGVRLVLAGPPNSGKSSLFNYLAGRDAAIVTPIAGTTRDRLEAPMMLEGVPFLLIDTAGLRDAPSDAVEAIGIQRSGAAMAEADILLWLGAPEDCPPGAVQLAPKADLFDAARPGLPVSVVTGFGLDAMRAIILDRARAVLPKPGALALHARHRTILAEVLSWVRAALATDDLLIRAESLRLARQGLDALTGRAGVESMLDALFGQFCIGK